MGSDWIDESLGNVLEIKYGKDHKKLTNGDIPCYGTGGVMRHVESSLYDEESILIPRKGSLNNIYFVDEPFWTVDTLFWTKLDKSLIYPKFMFYQLKLTDFTSLNVGSAVPSLTVPVLNDVKIKLPSIEEQKAIAHILGSLDDKIELNRQMNETLESMAQALFKSWFVDFDPVINKALAAGNPIPDVFAERAEQRLEQGKVLKSGGVPFDTAQDVPFKASENNHQLLFPSEFEYIKPYGWIPKGWAVNRFKDIVIKYIDNRGKTPPLSDDGIPLLEVKHLPENSLKPDLNTKKHVSSETYDTWFRAHLEPDDIIISTVGTIGRICLVPEGEKFTIAQNLIGLRFNTEKALPYFMYYQMDSFRFRHDVDARLVITVQASIKRKDLETIDLLSPPIELQSAFDSFIKPLIEKLSGDQNIQLAKLRDTLLPKLLSGELQIPDAEKLISEAQV